MSAERYDASGPLQGSLRPPPDKSISHRAAILAAMGEGSVAIDDYLDSADTRSTLAALRSLGTGVEVRPTRTGALEVSVHGIGLRGPAERSDGETGRIDVGNAGTLLRLLPGWLAGQAAGSWELDGDESIRRRPVDRIVAPLTEMGASLGCREGRLPPLHVAGAPLRGISYEMPIASAQVKSCVLLAGLLADGPTEILERTPSRDHTERMLRGAGARLVVERSGTQFAAAGGRAGQRTIRVEPAERIEPRQLEVPGDLSSAAFFIVAALLVPRSELRLQGVGLNPTRVGLLGILNRMGAAIEVEEEPGTGGEPRGTISVRHSSLTATRVGAEEVPLAIDELPLVALAACFAEGETVVRGAEELRHKESDRIATVVDGLRALGAEAEAAEDGFVVRGTGGLRGGSLDSHGDHRLAMLGAVAGLASAEGVAVRGMDAAGVSYSNFEEDLRTVLR